MKTPLPLIYVLLFAFLLMSTPSWGQIYVKSFEAEDALPYEKEALKRLKSSKVLFVYREDDDPVELQKVLDEVWDLSEIQLISYEDYKSQKVKPEFVFYIYSSIGPNSTLSGARNQGYTLIALNLSTKAFDKKGREKTVIICRIELSTDHEVLNYSGNKNYDDFLYSDAQIRNWEIGYLKSYLKYANDLLKSNKGKDLKSPPEIYTNEITTLTRKTLYIPEIIFELNKPKEGGKKTHTTEDKLLKYFPHQYKLINMEELVVHQM